MKSQISRMTASPYVSECFVVEVQPELLEALSPDQKPGVCMDPSESMKKKRKRFAIWVVEHVAGLEVWQRNARPTCETTQFKAGLGQEFPDSVAVIIRPFTSDTFIGTLLPLYQLKVSIHSPAHAVLKFMIFRRSKSNAVCNLLCTKPPVTQRGQLMLSSFQILH